MPTLAINKTARFDYEVLETFEAGIELSGQEVKTARQGQASLKSAHAMITKDREAFLVNANFPAYKMAGKLTNYDPTHSRKLLLHRKELDYLAGKIQQPGLTLVPISLYTKGKRIKLELALAKGKKLFDKRRTIKEREEKRKVQRVLKQRFSRG